MFSGKGSWYTLVDLSALITRLHNFYHHCGFTVTLWFLLVVSGSSWMQWPGRGKDVPSLVSPCPGSCQVEQALPGGTTGHKVQNRASHPGESLEMEFVEKTGQTWSLLVSWLHAAIPDCSFFPNIPWCALGNDKMAPRRSPASLQESHTPADVNPFQGDPESFFHQSSGGCHPWTWWLMAQCDGLDGARAGPLAINQVIGG